MCVLPSRMYTSCNVQPIYVDKSGAKDIKLSQQTYQHGSNCLRLQQTACLLFVLSAPGSSYWSSLFIVMFYIVGCGYLAKCDSMNNDTGHNFLTCSNNHSYWQNILCDAQRVPLSLMQLLSITRSFLNTRDEMLTYTDTCPEFLISMFSSNSLFSVLLL